MSNSNHEIEAAAIDRLKAKLAKTQGLARIRILNELASAIIESKPKAAKKYANAALREIGDSDHPEEKASALFTVGRALFKARRFVKAFDSFAKANELFDSANNHQQAAQCYYHMAESRYCAGRYIEAIEFYKRALSYFDNITDLKMTAQTAYRLGTAYGKTNNFDPALPVFEKASEAFEAIGDLHGVALIDGCIGLVYHGLGNFKEALKYHHRALKISEEQNDPVQIARNCVNVGNDYQSIHQTDTALRYLNRALKIREKSGDIMGLISVYINIGTLYFGERKYQLGIDYNLKALALNKKRSSIEVESFILNNIGNSYTSLKQFRKASRYLNKALKMVEGTGLPRNEELIIDSLALLAEARGDYKAALKYHKRLREHQNKIFNDQVGKKIAELEAKNEMKKREREIQYLKEKLSLQNRQLALLVGHSAEKRQLVDSFRQELARIKERAARGEDIFPDKKSLHKMLNTDKDMKKFREAFDQVYPGYYEGLSALSADLTSQEKNICLLIKIGLRSPTISDVLCISLRTVENHRFRIRKKINLPDGQNLKAFLEAYSGE